MSNPISFIGVLLKIILDAYSLTLQIEELIVFFQSKCPLTKTIFVYSLCGQLIEKKYYNRSLNVIRNIFLK